MNNIVMLRHYYIFFCAVWSPHRGLNSGPHSYQECALPLSYAGFSMLKKPFLVVQGTGFEPVKHKAADLQSAGFNHSPTPARYKVQKLNF